MIVKKLIKPISKVGIANVDLDNYYSKSEIDNKITMKHLNNAVSDLFVLETRNTNQGVFIGCENNLLTFINNTTINGIATPTSDNQCANKSYVDSQIANIPTTDLTNYYTKAEVNEKVDWEVVPSSSITRENNKTIIPLNGKRFVHLQGRFTQYTTSTGSWRNFTPFTLDTQNYNYMVRFPIFDWNTQGMRASIECSIENGNLVLTAYDTNNNITSYYLWGDVLVK